MDDPRRRVADERSLELHRLVAERLRSDPAVAARARARVLGWIRDGTVARPWAEAWLEVLEGRIDEIAAVLTDPSERARDLRRSSPFAGVIDPRTRWDVWRRVGASLEGR